MLDGHRLGDGACDFLTRVGDRAHRRSAQVEPDQVGRQEGIEGAAVSDVDRDRPPDRRWRQAIERVDEGRHALEAHPAISRNVRHHQAARALQAHRRTLHAAAFDRPTCQRDGGVAAHGRVALVVHEQHGEIGVGMIGLDQQRAIHAVVAARLEHQAAPQVIEALLRLAPLVEQRLPGEPGPAVDDDARRLAAGMHLHGGDDHPKTCARPTPMRSFIISIEPSV
jgi:hypothetical protein